MGWISFKFSVVCSTVLVFLALPHVADCQNHAKDPPADSKDIVGYRYDKNWWELGAAIDDVELKGFRPEETDDLSIEVYSDGDRAIWFGRDSIESITTLVFVKGVLGAIIIRTRDSGQDYKYYTQYYAKRFNRCTQIEESPDRNSWLDKDDDSVTVEKQPYWFGCPTIPPESVIVYLRRHVIQPNPAGDMPQWIYFLINGVGYFGVS